MAESVEHNFLSEQFLSVVEEMSRVKLYGLTEPDRKMFDFACVFQRDWRRPLVGQTLWKHSAGIDKDVRTLLSSIDADIWAYVVRDTIKNRALLHEAVRDYRRSRYSDELFKLKVIWIPADFDADNELARSVMAEHLRNSVTSDILFNVIFGNLSANDVRIFLGATRMDGLNLVVLQDLATREFVSLAEMGRRLEVSAGPLRERILSLLASGMIWHLDDESTYFASLRGRVFLELLKRIWEGVMRRSCSPELLFILSVLGIEPEDEIASYERLISEGWTPANTFQRLMITMIEAHERWGFDFKDLAFVYHQSETDPLRRVMR